MKVHQRGGRPGGLCFFAAAAMVVAGCGADDGTGAGPGTSGGGDIDRALGALPHATVAAIHASDRVPSFVQGELGSAPAGTPVADAASVMAPIVRQIAPVFRLRPENLRLTSVERDNLDATHLRYAQYKNGLRVAGGEIDLHFDRGGMVYSVNAVARDGVELPTQPGYSASAAVDRARATLGAMTDAQFSEPELVYARRAGTGALRLAWEMEVQGRGRIGPTRDRMYVDAMSGAVINRQAMIHTALSRRVHDGEQNTDEALLPGTLRRSEGQAAHSDAIVNTAYANAGVVYNFYNTYFGRDSYDGAGAALDITVHFDTGSPNAFWDGAHMVYDDGDGTTFGNLANSLDITAHELTHAVVEHTANLVYQGESGALNESFADIMGAACEAWSNGGTINANTWRIGEEIYTPATPGDALRYMNDPTADGNAVDYYPNRLYATLADTDYNDTNDYGGVHDNSGIGNLAFVLLVAGGRHPQMRTDVMVRGVGLERAAKIFYRALSRYLTTNSDFAAARAATAQAAADLYDRATVASVHQAWDAVGVPRVSTTPGAAGDGGVRADGGTTAGMDAGVSARDGGFVGPRALVGSGPAAPGLSGAAGTSLTFQIDVPAGARDLMFRTTGGTGDADLYASAGSIPTPDVSDLRSAGSANEELVVEPAPAAGRWYVVVHGYGSFEGVTLSAAYATGGATTNELSNGVPVTDLAGDVNEDRFFTITVPAGARNLSFRLSGGTGDADLFARRGLEPSTEVYDLRSNGGDNNESVVAADAPAGTWHVLVRGYRAYMGASLVATYDP